MQADRQDTVAAFVRRTYPFRVAHRLAWYTRKAFGWYRPRDGWRVALSYLWAQRRWILRG